MTNYLLSIDPSIKNTGFTLWEKDCELNCKYLWHPIESNTPHTNDIWKPIWIKSFCFSKYNEDNFYELFYLNITNINSKIGFFSPLWEWKLDLIIERGTFHSKNGIGYETQEHLRGFIAGQFNKLLTKDMLVHNLTWKKWYIDNNITNISLKKWNKKISEDICFYLNEKYEWNIHINNHDEADSLLIGWYYLNKENK